MFFGIIFSVSIGILPMKKGLITSREGNSAKLFLSNSWEHCWSDSAIVSCNKSFVIGFWKKETMRMKKFWRRDLNSKAKKLVETETQNNLKKCSKRSHISAKMISMTQSTMNWNFFTEFFRTTISSHDSPVQKW